MPIKTEKLIIQQYLQNSRGIRGAARYFGLQKSYVGAIINKYKKKHNIR
tara:strand:- start:382 stop:528 length:147 start_codon:yes stop_codon:yes gene_type:complete